MRSYGNRLLIIIVLSFILCALLITNITRCSHNKKMTTDFYAGRGDKWLATYTIIKTNSMYYETLYIQYLLNSKTPLEELDAINEIEYSLAGEEQITASSGPLLLGDRASITIVNLLDPASAKHVSGDGILITISWSGYEETARLDKLDYYSSWHSKGVGVNRVGGKYINYLPPT